MKIKICGGGAAPPNRITIPKTADLTNHLMKYIQEDNRSSAILLSCQTGGGKTRAVKTGIIPWAQKEGMCILYVSSRIAINTQTKTDVLDTVGLSEIRTQLTDAGLRAKEDFGPVRIITYQKLYSLMVSNPCELQEYDILIFDEIHALLDDSMFVGCSGYVLENIPKIFCGSLRLYLTATPDAILPLLSAAEAPNPITVLHIPRDYNYVDPHFFSKMDFIVNKINEDKTNQKWLVYIEGISAGCRFCEQLKQPWCMLNSKERDLHPEKWYGILEKQCFEEKVCVVTSVVGEGVNFQDSLLQHVVVFSLRPNTIIQVLGRKRRKNGERVNLYVYNPSENEIRRKLEMNTRKRAALDSFQSGRAKFINCYILDPKELDLRPAMHLHSDGEIVPNHLARIYLENEAILLQKLLDKARVEKDAYYLDKVVCRWLRIPQPDRNKSWLDATEWKTAQSQFFNFLNDHCEESLDDDGFCSFMKEFMDKCIRAFGKGPSDRTDRPWGATKFRNKMVDLKLSYHLECHNGIYRITKETSSNLNCTSEDTRLLSNSD